MTVVQIGNVPSYVRPGEIRRLLDAELEVTRFYLRPREMLPNGDYVKDGQYDLGFFECMDAAKARAFVERHNGLPMASRTGKSARKLSPRLRSAVWSLTILNYGWEVANRSQYERYEARERIIDGEMAYLGALNRAYLEALEGDKRHMAGIVTVDEMKSTVPYIQYIPRRPRNLDTIRWVSFIQSGNAVDYHRYSQ